MGWGSSTRRGGGRKVRALPQKFIFLGNLGCTRNFAGMSLTLAGVQKLNFVQNKFVFIFRPLTLVVARVYVPHFLGNDAKEANHIKMFSGDNGAKGPKQALLGHAKFSLCCFPFPCIGGFN